MRHIREKWEERAPEWERRKAEWDGIREEIIKSEGFQADKRVKALIRGYGILADNQVDLVRALEMIDRPESLPIWDYNHPERLDQFMDHVTRLLHNFVASAVSLIDHTRNIITGAYADGDELRVEYATRVRLSFVAPFPKFVKDLRNYTLHNRLPGSSATMRWSIDNPNPGRLGASIVIHPEDLILWDGWTADAKLYLKTAPENIDLRDIANDYHAIVRPFYEWLVNALQDKHAVDIEYANTLVDREHALLGRPTRAEMPKEPE